MNFTQYKDIFAKNLVASARRLKLDRKWIFQRDSNLKQTSTSTNNWAQYQHFAMAISVETH
jgi:hypothetical protein